MLRVDCQKGSQQPEDLRRAALEAPHQRTRERLLALFLITQGRNATQVAQASGRHFQTVQGWVHAYNEQGPGALAYQRTGGRPPFVHSSSRS